MMLVPDFLPQRLHRRDFVELTERARRGRPHSHGRQPSRGRERSGLSEGPEGYELEGPIEVD